MSIAADSHSCTITQTGDVVLCMSMAWLVPLLISVKSVYAWLVLLRLGVKAIAN